MFLFCSIICGSEIAGGGRDGRGFGEIGGGIGIGVNPSPADSLQEQEKQARPRGPKGRFQPGKSGNPRGRSRGSHNRATLLMLFPAACVVWGIIETARCLRPRWDLYHGGIILCLYMDLMAATLVFFSLVPIGIPLVFLGLHLGVAVIQAYVFLLLASIYLSLAVAHDH